MELVNLISLTHMTLLILLEKENYFRDGKSYYILKKDHENRHFNLE